MYEHRKQNLLSKEDFSLRVMQTGVIAFAAMVVALSLGILGYHFFAQLTWIDSFLNASMILSGMGPVNEVKTTSGKLFSGLYALFSGLFFIAVSGVLLAPFLHRFLHRFHLEKKGINE